MPTETLLDTLPPTLESLFPGFSLLAPIVSYLQIDISSYSVYIILSTVLALFFGFVLPQFFNNIQQLLLYLAISVEIKYQNTLHNQLIKWISANDSLNQSWHSIASAKSALAHSPWEDEKDDENQTDNSAGDQKMFENERKLFWRFQKDQSRMKPIRFTPSQNKLHFFLYKRHVLGLRRELHPNTSNIWLANAENITTYSFFWNKRVLIDLLQEVQRYSLDQKSDQVTIYRGLKQQNMVSWVSITSKPPRPLSTLVLAPQVKEEFKEDIENFLSPKNKLWYQSRGMPFRRGYLLYGPPGTGKSSMCFVMAGRLHLDIYTISLNSPKLDEDGLARLFQNLPRRCIVLLEDVDSARIRKESNMGTQEPPDNDRLGNSFEDCEPINGGISLSALLNCLDGVGAQEGRILIMTANNKCELDDALIRPGRVDKSYEFGFADIASIKQLFLVFYTGTMDDKSTYACLHESSTGTDLTDLSIKFSRIIPSGEFTAAGIYNYLMDFKEDPYAAVAEAEKWIKRRHESEREVRE